MYYYDLHSKHAMHKLLHDILCMDARTVNKATFQDLSKVFIYQLSTIGNEIIIIEKYSFD